MGFVTHFDYQHRDKVYMIAHNNTHFIASSSHISENINEFLIETHIQKVNVFICSMLNDNWVICWKCDTIPFQDVYFNLVNTGTGTTKASFSDVSETFFGIELIINWKRCNFCRWKLKKIRIQTDSIWLSCNMVSIQWIIPISHTLLASFSQLSMFVINNSNINYLIEHIFQTLFVQFDIFGTNYIFQQQQFWLESWT